MTNEPAGLVLVVEAEPLLQIMAVEMIEDAGFRAVTARSVNQAIEMLETRADIRVVFTDVDMPNGLDGMRLAACIRDRWPPIEIILTSGGVRPADGDMPARSVFLRKPYSKRLLTDAVRRFAA